MRKITIKDVARQAGVSIATVSRVINKNYFVSPALEEKVTLAIAQLGYYPNFIARNLKYASTFTIGFMVFNISNTYFMKMAKSLEDRIHQANYSLIVCSTEEDRKRELLLLSNLASNKIDGLVVLPTGENEQAIIDLSRIIPTVLVHQRIKKPGFLGDFVDSNNVEGAYTLTRHLVESGHRDIGVINGPLMRSSAGERYQGFKKALRRAGLPLRSELVYNGDYSFASGYEGVRKIMECGVRPSAVVVMNHEMALGALAGLRTKKIAVPGDLSLVAYGSIDNIDLLYVRPTIVTQDPIALGRNCARCLLERIVEKNLPNREVIYQPELVQGNSVRILNQPKP